MAVVFWGGEKLLEGNNKNLVFWECVIRFMPPTYTFMSSLEKVCQINQNGSIKEIEKKKKTLVR